MATSGTTDQTIFTTQQVIDHAFRRMKMPAELISGEKIDSALENLWLILQGLANKGAPVWRVQTLLMSLYYNQVEVRFDDPGVVRIMNANLRTMSRVPQIDATSTPDGDASLAVDSDLDTACTQTIANGNIALDFGAPVLFDTVGFLPNVSGTWSYRWEASLDGVTWEVLATVLAQSVVNRGWRWLDLNLTQVGGFQYVRLIGITNAGIDTTLDVRELYVGMMQTSIPLGLINKDDYFNLPNKNQLGRPTQAWQDMQRDNPVLRVYNVPNQQYSFALVEAQVQRMIQDVGTMAQQLDIPQRWYDGIVWTLAEMQADDDPDYKGGLEGLQRLERKAKAAMDIAWGGVTLSGPTRIAPNISGYTRG